MFIFQHCNSQSKASETYHLLGKIVHDGVKHVPCGFEAFAYLYVFEIISYSDNKYAARKIAVLIPCPELYGENFFENGKSYKLNVTKTKGSFVGLDIFDQKKVKKSLLREKVWLVENTLVKID